MQTNLLTKRGWNRFACHALGILLVILLAAAQAGAQRITGNIAGTVKDEQGAMVTTAAVKATNTETGFNRTTPVSADGTFLVQYLPVGTYTVAVEAPGFKKFVQQNVTVAVDQTVPLSVTLTVGAQTQTVEVTEAPPLVETSTAELGRSVSPAEIIGLPLVNRNAYAQLSLTAGVMSNSASPQSNPNGTPNFQYGVPSTQVVVNGGIDAGVPMVSYYLDGGINMTGLRNYGNPLPNPDALQEFRVETNNFAAQYGRMSGAVVTAVTKSGTNSFHGSLFEFNRNSALNAYNWRASSKAHYRRNQFGGAIGGPIRHDKAFAFFSYAGLRQVVGQQLTGAIVPTTAERLGDFTGDSAVTIYMPKPANVTAAVWNVPANLANGVNTSAGCATVTSATAGKCIPQALLDKTAAALMTKYIPAGNGATYAAGGQDYKGFFTGPTNQDEYLGKFDDVLSDRDHVAASYFYLNTTQDAYGNGNIPYMINRSYSKQHVLNISDIHTFGGSTANQTWFTMTRVVGGRTNYPTVGIDDLGSTFTTQGPKTLPQLSITGYFSAGGALAGPVNATTFLSLRDMVSQTRGKHSLDFGGEVSLEKDPVLGNLINFGSFSFSKSAPTTTNNALADFVSGQVASMEQDTPYHAVTSNWYYALFLQDTYRVTQRLTLNLGIRYDIQQAPVESHNLNASFVPNVQSKVVPTAPLGMQFVGDPGVSRGITGTKYHHISPRVGISWDPFGDGKTAIRAGGGVFYGSVAANEWNQPANAQPFAIRQTFNSITSFSNVYTNTASFPTGNPFPYTYTPANPRFITNASIETISLKYQWPLAYQFNAAIQRQLPQHVSATVAYVSTLTRHMPFFMDANYAPYNASICSSTTQACIDARRPYNNNHTLGNVLYLESQENASYHSLQVTANRPLTKNIMLAGFYVLSHNLETVNPGGVGGGSAQDHANLWEERGPTDTDRRHVASISGMWKIDYYHGENRIVKQVVNGWTISPIISLQSGAPVNISTGANNNFDSANTNRPNRVVGVNPFLDPHRSRVDAANAWFNTAAFTPNGPGLGIGPGGADGNTPRDFLRAPGYRNIDLGLLRDFRFQRGITFQVRGEATNAFNLVSLNGPTASLSSANNGKITSAGTPRLIQVGGRFTF